MALKSMRVINPKDYDMDVIQRNTKEFVQQLENNIILDGVLLKDVDLASANATVINHKLNREYQGWMIVKINANANVWQSASTLPKSHLTLNCSADCTVDLYIY